MKSECDLTLSDNWLESNGYKRFGLAYYKAQRSSKGFGQARQTCQNDGGELLTLTTKSDVDAGVTLMGGGLIWIGKLLTLSSFKDGN